MSVLSSSLFRRACCALAPAAAGSWLTWRRSCGSVTQSKRSGREAGEASVPPKIRLRVQAARAALGALFSLSVGGVAAQPLSAPSSSSSLDRSHRLATGPRSA